MHRLIRFLWITYIFRKHRSHRHLRVLHTKTFFPQKLSTLMWISALSGSNSLPSSPLSPTTPKRKTPRAADLKRSHAGCSTFIIFQFIRLRSVLRSVLRSLTAVCLRGSRRFPHRFPLPVHTGFCASRRCSLRLRRSFP